VSLENRVDFVQRAMRVLAGIDQHPTSLQFPLNTGAYMDFF
jgi:hypothetical protein